MMSGKQFMQTVDSYNIVDPLMADRAVSLKRINFVDVVMDIGLGLMIGFIFMNLAMSVYVTISVTAWDSTSQLIWHSIPWAGMGAFIIATIRFAQNPSGY